MIGSRLAHYSITGHLGSGGMGDVFQATDSKLGRSVAIKLLPEAFARDSDRIGRFEREARVLASLNHSNIASIYGIEQSDGRNFLVMELVPGETLAERITRGPVPEAEALVIAKQIAEALEAAHEKSIVHRDLKPANIKIAPDGKVKVLDFGLAKALESETSNPNVSQSPTMSGANASPLGRSHQGMALAATNAGVILGTAAYMSPEQAKGRAVDRRTDIFAFGCVLYEMLSGRRAFDGEDIADVLSAVLRSEPDWSRLPADVSPSVRKLLRLCLEKDLKRRRRDAGDLLLDIEEASKDPGVQPAAVSAAKGGGKLGWIAAAGVAIIAIVAIGVALRPPAETPEMRLEVTTPATQQPLEIALSPDGRSLVFVASADGLARLWLRRLDKADASPLAGTEGALFPFWSPDNHSIAFFASGKLKRIDIAGGSATALADISASRGGSWSKDGAILFAGSGFAPLSRIPASGGEPVAVTRLQQNQTGHRYPQFLPDGHHFLFFAGGTPDVQGIYLGSLDGTVSKRLTPADSAGSYLQPDRLVFVRQGALIARKLDLGRGELSGDPETLADPVGYDSTVFFGGFSISTDGRVAYRTGGAVLRQLSWFDRSGKPLGNVGEPDVAGLVAPVLSPDGRHIAVDRTVQGNRDVWLIDILRGGKTRLTSDPATDGFPVWSSDGTQIAFESQRKGNFDVYLKTSNGVGAEQVVLDSPNAEWPLDWSKDGRFILYHKTNSTSFYDIWALPMFGTERTPIAVATTPFSERTGAISPDGRWVAYDTDESGRLEVVVQPFPNPTAKWTISTSGGRHPLWSTDGKELYFISPDRKLMAASVRGSAASFEAGSPSALFQTRIAVTGPTSDKQQYAVSRDGRFLINQAVEETTASPITLILNWKPSTK